MYMKRTFMNTILFILLIVATFFLTQAVYEPKEEAVSLLGTWTWTSSLMLDGTQTVPEQATAFTITFTEDGEVFGTTDCNNFFGTYTVYNGSLTFGPLGSTLMFCENAQEGIFLDNLSHVGGYTVEHEGNLFMTSDSQTMSFIKSE